MADINVSFYNIDFAKLVVERDFTNEANRMLPRVIEEFSKATAARAWKKRQQISGANDSEKKRFIQQAIEAYHMDPTQKERVRNIVVEQLKEQKKQHDRQAQFTFPQTVG